MRRRPGEVVDLKTWAHDQPNARTKAIVKTREIELIRLSLPAKKEIPNHKVNGPITIHCVVGKAEFTAMGVTQEIRPNQLIHLMPGELHSVKAIEDTVILLTIIFKNKN